MANRSLGASVPWRPLTSAGREALLPAGAIITCCEMRMADEIDRGQASGELPTAGNPHGSNSPKLGELNISSQRLSEWRETREAGEENGEGPGVRLTKGKRG